MFKAFTGVIRRQKIIKKHYRSIGDSILKGERDEELISRSKESQYTAHGLAAPFDNEAHYGALDEIKSKGLKNYDESSWITGDLDRGLMSKEEQLIAEKITIRGSKLGINILS